MQFGMNAWTPTHLPTSVIYFLDLIGEYLIGSAMLAYWPLPPRIIVAERHPKRLAEDAERILLAILFHHLVPHLVGLD